MSTCSVTRCRSTRSTRAASTSAPPAVRSTARPTAATAGRRSSRTCRRCCPSRSRQSRDVGHRRPRSGDWRLLVTTVRVVLPGHLKRLADIEHEVELSVADPATLTTVLDALEATYPVLRGTIRDQASGKRRNFIRFFACEQD